jgi:addiction module HigA family antidote
MMRMAKPSHPGLFIRTEIVEPHGLSVTDAAKVLGVTRPALSALLNGRAALSAEMALRVEKAFGVNMDTLLRMQTSYEIAETRRNAGRIRVKPFVSKALAA